MAKLSLLTTDTKHCYICGKTGVEEHHILFGTGRKKLSDKYGLTVPLCYEHHQGTDGVHGKNGMPLNLQLKKEAQVKFESIYGHEEWMRVFGRSYL